MIYVKPVVQIVGDSCIKISFGNERSIRVNKLVRQFEIEIKKSDFIDFVEILSTYCDLSVFYNQFDVSFDLLLAKIHLCIDKYNEKNQYNTIKRALQVPVCYHENFAQDLAYICSNTGLNKDEIVNIHTSSPYFIFQLGFSPGCPFIGPLQPKLHVPLLPEPRTETPEGAVALSIGQTVIYPRVSPGGMSIIGRTPVMLFDIQHDDLTLFKPGDWVKFEKITKKEFEKMSKNIKKLYDEVQIILYG